ncbi:MAG: methyl-accepting chemotaxis protein [Pseudomonadota bacterium]
MDQTSSLHSVVEELDIQLSPLSTALLGMLVDINLSAGQDPDAGARIKAGQDLVNGVISRMGGVLEVEFTRSGTALPADLKEQAAELCATLRAALRQLSPTPVDTPPEAVAAIADLVRNKLQGQVGTLRKGLADLIVGASAQTGRHSSGLDHTAIEQIDNISSRINLIAINASIEAARVGEAGRGFAVIASEIQDLSQQSQQAVRDIRKESA